jgi:hypothetical protein
MEETTGPMGLDKTGSDQAPVGGLRTVEGLIVSETGNDDKLGVCGTGDFEGFSHMHGKEAVTITVDDQDRHCAGAQGILCIPDVRNSYAEKLGKRDADCALA